MKNALILLSGLLMMASCTKTAKLTYSGKDITVTASMVKDKETRKTYLKLTDMAGDWQVYNTEGSGEVILKNPVFASEGSGTFDMNVPFESRNIYFLSTRDGSGPIAETLLPMEGGYNFRDLGGIKTRDGRHVKWNMLFRSDDLSTLTGSDLAYLESIPITSVIDFRSPREIEAAPDRVPLSATDNYYPYSINPGNLNAAAEDLKDFTGLNIESLMMAMNESFVSDPAIVNVYKNFFSLLQNESKAPLLFHCSAGKDRTGMAAALVLYALGADDRTVMDNYLESNKYIGEKYAAYVYAYPGIKSLFEVKAEFLQAGIDRINSLYGSVDNFLTQNLGADLARLRLLYLY